MSIDDVVLDRVNRGMLFPLLPYAPGESSRRAMFVEVGLWELLNSPEGDDEWERRVGELRADLERFVTGDYLDPKYLFLLYPSSDAVWEIRSVQPDPSIRVMGSFPKIDVFVATQVALRKVLGGWNSREWKQVKRNAAAAWRRLFDPYKPIVTTDVNHVVTGAISGRYFKIRG